MTESSTFRKLKIMASGPITSWEIHGETVETVSDFIFWGSKITAGNGIPLKYSCLENLMDGGACRLQSMELLRVGHD